MTSKKEWSMDAMNRMLDAWEKTQMGRDTIAERCQNLPLGEEKKPSELARLINDAFEYFIQNGLEFNLPWLLSWADELSGVKNFLTLFIIAHLRRLLPFVTEYANTGLEWVPGEEILFPPPVALPPPIEVKPLPLPPPPPPILPPGKTGVNKAKSVIRLIELLYVRKISGSQRVSWFQGRRSGLTWCIAQIKREFKIP